MCAGRCREPRRKGTWVADLSGCVVPWAARASCWPQPQQLLPVSVAGSGRRCCTGAFPRRTIRRVLRVALAAFSAAPWQGFEKAERCPSLASLFPPQAAVGSAAVRIHPLYKFNLVTKQKPQRIVYVEAFWWARVDYASRAAKNSPLGCFYAVFCDSAAAVRIHPPYEFSLVTKQKPQRIVYAEVFWWARVDSNHRS